MKKRKTLIRWKIYIDRARMYVGYIQFLMIAIMFLDNYRGDGLVDWIFDNKLISFPIVFILLMVVSLVLGRIDTVLGLRQEELRNNSEANPMIKKIHDDVEEIKKKIEKMGEEK